MGSKGVRLSENTPNGDCRRNPRVPLSLLVQYRFDTLGDFLDEYASDISLSGIFVHTAKPHKVGSLIYLQFYLRDGSTLIEGLGRVVRVTPQGMGIEFVNFDEDSIQLVEQIVESNLEKE